MALDPKPISLTQVDAEDYDSPNAPQPFVVVGPVPLAAALADIAGYDAQEVQTLTNDEGELKWVTVEG